MTTITRKVTKVIAAIRIGIDRLTTWL